MHLALLDVAHQTVLRALRDGHEMDLDLFELVLPAGLRHWDALEIGEDDRHDRRGVVGDRTAVHSERVGWRYRMRHFSACGLRAETRTCSLLRARVGASTIRKGPLGSGPFADAGRPALAPG